MDLTGERSQKITPRHLRRQAYLYVRQSTLRQVVENTESTQRQYGPRARASAPTARRLSETAEPRPQHMQLRFAHRSLQPAARRLRV
jgi:hypothetical protein